MGKHNKTNNPEPESNGNKIKFFLAGALCMLVVSAVAIGSVWYVGASTNKKTEAVFESGGFDSPENAVRAYLNGYKSINIEEMLSAFAIETFVQHFNSDAQVINDMQFSSVLSSTLTYPNKCKVLIRDNIYQRLFYIEKGIADQVLGYANPDLSSVTIDDYEYLGEEEFVKAVHNLFPEDSAFDALSDLTIVKFLEPNEISVSNSGDTTLEEYTNIAYNTYGVDKLQNVAVSCDIAGQGYYLLFTAYQYGDKWFLGDIGGTLTVSLPNGKEIIKGIYKIEK